MWYLHQSTGERCFKEKRAAVGKIQRQLCEWKGVNILEAEECPDHVHMLLEIPPKIAVSSFMRCKKRIAQSDLCITKR